MNAEITPQSALHLIAQIDSMEKGSLHVIRQGPEGPYYNLQFIENGKHVSRYVPRSQVEQVRQAIEGYHQFTRLTDEYAQMIIEKTRAERLEGAKTNSRPASPSPRRRRSRG